MAPPATSAFNPFFMKGAGLHGGSAGAGVRRVTQPDGETPGPVRGFFRFVLAIALLAGAMTTQPAQAQVFIQQPFVGTGLVGPQALGMSEDDAPPDLDEPQLGEDPETAPLAEDDDEEAAERKRKPARKPLHFGQNHTSAPPLPLQHRLRRALRDSLLGGGEDFWFTRPRAKNIYFIAFEAKRHDHYLTVGNKRALFGTHDTAGWRVMAMRGVKIGAEEPLLNARPLSTPHTLKLMPGYEWRAGTFSGAVYAGLGYNRNSFSDTLLTGQYGRYGVSAMAEFWYGWGQLNPALARFTSGYVVAETAGRSFSFGLRHGVALPGVPFLVGPEGGWSAARAIFAGPRVFINGVPVFRGHLVQAAYRAGRLGGHISEIPLFAARLRLSAGAEWRSARKPGAYVEFAAYLPY